MDCQAFVTACKNLGSVSNHAEAESALISLRSSPHAVETALEVLRTTSDDLVAFHAALLLRDAALRQYQTAGLDAELGLMQKGLDLALTRNVKGPGDALLQCTAAIYKRCFLDAPDDFRNSLMAQRIPDLLASPQTAPHAIRLLLHIIWEFGLTSQSTFLGQTMEFHAKCGRLFTKIYLKDVFVFVASRLSQLQSPEACQTALDVLDAILSWPFEIYSATSFNSSAASFLYSVPADHRAGTHHLRNASRRITPRAAWSFLVKSDEFCQALLALYAKGTSEIKSRIQQIFISLACLSGDIFENETIQVSHAKRIAGIGYSLCENAFRDQTQFKRNIDLEEHESELGAECLAGTVIVARALTITRPDLLLRDESLLPSLVGLTLAISQMCRLCSVPYETTFLGECLRTLTGVWVIFVSHVMADTGSGPNYDDKSKAPPPPSVVSSTQANASLVFQSLVQTRWQTCHLAKESTEVEDDDEAESEEMGDLASIARAALLPSLSHLVSLLKGFDDVSHDSPETRVERLSFLCRVLANVLADPDEGEVPVIPRVILDYSRKATEAREEDIVVAASVALLEVFQRETTRLNLVSPLLSQHLMDAVRRWASSYLLPSPSLYAQKSRFRGGIREAYGGDEDEIPSFASASSYGSSTSLSPALQAAFADLTRGVEILNFVIRSACVHLATFGSEQEVGESAVALLDACARNKNHLKTSMGWQELCVANVNSIANDTWEPLSHVSAESHGNLVRVLSSALSSSEDFAAVCAQPMSTRLAKLIASSSKDQPKWTSDAVRLCELFRGCAKSGYSGSDLNQRVRAHTIREMPSLVSLAEVRRDAVGGEVVLLGVLTLYADFCESQLSFTESNHLPVVFGTSKRLVELYAFVETQNKQLRDRLRQGKARVQGDSDELEFRANSLNKLLRMLIALSERNSLDFSSSDADVVASGREDDASGTVLQCIDAVLPLFDADLFHVSEVVESYFELVAGICRTRPEHIAGLESALFAAVINSLSFGCEHYDSKIQRWCFESVGSLAKLQAETQGQALSFHMASKPSVIFDFIFKILDLVVTSADMSSLDAAAGALLNLARCDQQAFGNAVEAILAKASVQRREGVLIDPGAENSRIQTLVQVMRSQFEKMFDGVRVQGADRTDRKKFATNLTTFVKEVRAYVLIK